ncbi:MAG: glycosyltransferase family 4 protein [Erysipelotrichaceae bacterium]|nr:glycosyltransferase family 4 protein [Erysipelotrichaceae bacterium]
MKLCFLIDDYSAVGGIQRIVPLVASALSADHEVHAVSMYQQNGDNNRDFYGETVTLTTLISGKKDYLKQAFPIVGLLKRYLKDHDIDILIASSEMLVPYAWLASAALKIPFLCWTHTPALSYDETFLQRPFKWLAVRKAASIVALTEKTKKEYQDKYHNRNIVVIPNPVDPKLMKDVSYRSDSKRIVSVGRICYQKYYEKLVEVAAIVLKENRDWTWDICGDGNERENIEELIKNNGLEDRLILKGNVSDMYDRYREYGLQVMTSRFEGFPMTLLEGMANGLPLVAFDVNGVAEVIKDGYNGYLIEAFDEKKMAERIDDLIKNEELRRTFSDNNVELRNKYSIGYAIERWNELFAKVKK